MGKAKHNKKIKSEVVILNPRKRINITKFREKMYCHFNDQYSRKSLTFTSDEMRKLQKLFPKLMLKMKKLNGKEKKSQCEDELSDVSESPYNSSQSEGSDSD